MTPSMCFESVLDFLNWLAKTEVILNRIKHFHVQCLRAFYSRIANDVSVLKKAKTSVGEPVIRVSVSSVLGDNVPFLIQDVYSEFCHASYDSIFHFSDPRNTYANDQPSPRCQCAPSPQSEKENA